MKSVLWMSWAGAAMLACAGMAGAQYTPPPPPLTTAPCVPTRKEPCPSTQAPAAKTDTKKPEDAFPFPGDTPSAPADTSKEFPFPGETSAPVNAPDAPATSSAPSPNKTDAAGKSAQQEHPFPEDESSSSSSSGSGGADAKDKDDEDGPALKDLGSEGSTKSERRKLVKVQDPAAREDEDLTVSKFYQDRGNFKAAYMRAQDAVKSMPKDPDAHLRLAETAAKMKLKDEAIAEYTKYLSMDPPVDKAKTVRQALAELQ